MYWVTTAALFVFGVSLAFTAVKVLFELPSWLVRSALYVIVTAIYVVALTTSREAGFGWFHLIWSIILMVLIFGLLQKQSSHVCRWSLFIAGSCLASLLLYAVAAAIHRQAGIWLHRAYINRAPTGFPDLILLGFPFGVMIGLLLAWIGTKKDRTTGHAIAAHWSWWCVQLNVALLFAVVGCLLLNDRVMCAKRDAIIARARELRERVDGLTSKFNIEGWPTDLDGADVAAAVDGQYSKLRKLTPDHVVALADERLKRAEWLLDSDDVQTAVNNVVVATNAVDQGISFNGPGSTYFAQFERDRLELIWRIVILCDVQYAPLLAKLVTDRPYSNLEPPLPPKFNGFHAEQSKLYACSLALRSFTNDPYVVPPRGQRLSFWWRFLGLRHGIAAAEPELNFTLPPAPATPSYSYAEPQFIRVLANAAVRGVIVTMNENRVPEPDEIFVGELSAQELRSVNFVPRGRMWTLCTVKSNSADGSEWQSLDLRDNEGLIEGEHPVDFSFGVDYLRQ